MEFVRQLEGHVWLRFARDVPAARCHHVEPDAANLELGRHNFTLNGLAPASVTDAFVDAAPGKTADDTTVVSVVRLAADLGIGQIHLRHADIQAFDLAMLHGAGALLAGGRVDFWFISTHGAELHRDCRARLARHGLPLLLDVPPAHSYSIDGVLVAHRPGVANPGSIVVALRLAP